MSVNDKCIPHHGSEGPLPRPERRRRQSKDDRGLPPDAELMRLATVYLEHQRRLWPEFAEAGLLPEPTAEVTCEMARDFKERHRTGKVEFESIRPYAAVFIKLGGSYSRYSCDNSSPLSIVDQLVNELNKAHAEGRFIPWGYVFADYSVRGTDASRRGYISYKAVVASEEHRIETTYIDDFSRASRDEIEWWRLAGLSKRLGKRMIGASDGFDLSSQDWELKVGIYGIVSRLFLKGLKEKVKRGMHGAARRRTCLGKLPLGFTRQVHRDQQGQVVLGRDDRPTYEPCIDPITRHDRLLMFELFVTKGWSPYKIARHFNQLKVDGWEGWTAAAVKKLLRNPTAIGVFIWNRTRREFDYEESKYIIVKNPRSEWVVFYDRNLAIVPMDLYRAARRKLAAIRRKSPLTDRKPSRNEVSASTLFSGTLFCEHCQSELKLIRSTEKYQQLGCYNGVAKAHGCKLSASKSTRIIEACLLGFLRDVLFGEETINKLVCKVNEHLSQEAQKPLIDVAPLKAKLHKTNAKINRLVESVEECEDKSARKAYEARVGVLHKEVEKLKGQIRDANVCNRRKKCKPLERLKAEDYLAGLPTTLQEEIPAAAEAIRQLTGKIMIRQEPLPGHKSRCRWIATFSPNLVQVLRVVLKDCPTALLTEIQDLLGQEKVEVLIEKIPKYERLAPKFKKLKEGGASTQSIASAHGISWQYANEILEFAKTGERPKWKAGKRTGTGGKAAKYREVVADVVRMRDAEKIPFERIAEILGTSKDTVSRAYDCGRPDAVREAAEKGKRPRRGSYSRLGEDVIRKVRELLLAGQNPKDAAREAGCSPSTARRLRKQMESGASDGQAA